MNLWPQCGHVTRLAGTSPVGDPPATGSTFLVFLVRHHVDGWNLTPLARQNLTSKVAYAQTLGERVVEQTILVIGIERGNLGVVAP